MAQNQHRYIEDYPQKPYEVLANEIIIRAATDYKQALKKLKKHPHDKHAAERIAECEKFFRSRWYRKLTDVDGEFLMQRLRRSVR